MATVIECVGAVTASGGFTHEYSYTPFSDTLLGSSTFDVDLTPLAAATYWVAFLLGEDSAPSIFAAPAGWSQHLPTVIYGQVWASNTFAPSITVQTGGLGRTSVIVLGFTEVTRHYQAAVSSGFDGPDITHVASPNMTFSEAVDFVAVAFSAFKHEDNTSNPSPPSDLTLAGSYDAGYTQLAEVADADFRDLAPPLRSYHHQRLIAAAWKPAPVAGLVPGATYTVTGGDDSTGNTEIWLAWSIVLALPAAPIPLGASHAWNVSGGVAF